MDIDLEPGWTPKHKVGFPGIWSRDVCVASTFQKTSDRRHVRMCNGDVQIPMLTRLLTQNCVNCPSAIQPHLNGVPGEKPQDRCDLFDGHDWRTAHLTTYYEVIAP